MAILRKKYACMAMCGNSIEENKNRYKCMKNKAKKGISMAMREKTSFFFFFNCPNWMFRLVKGLKK